MKCDGCTACCEHLDIPWMDSPSGSLCKECTGSACGVWDTAPLDCKTYNCVYVQQDRAPIELRPDLCGVIFEKLSHNLMFGLMFKRQIPDLIIEQIKNFNHQGYSVVIDVMHDKKLFAFPKEGKTENMVLTMFRAHQNKLEVVNGSC